MANTCVTKPNLNEVKPMTATTKPMSHDEAKIWAFTEAAGDRCGKCRFWTAGRATECRRHTPTADRYGAGCWPRTDAFHWCGEFAQADKPGVIAARAKAAEAELAEKYADRAPTPRTTTTPRPEAPRYSQATPIM